MDISGQTAFSTSGEDAITRSINVEFDKTAESLSGSVEFANFYDIDRTVDEIVNGAFKRVSSFTLRNPVIHVFKSEKAVHSHFLNR